MRLIELQNESDSAQACHAAGRAVVDENLRGWAALLPLDPPVLAEGLKHGGLAVLRGSKQALAMGSLSQLWGAARSLADALEKPQSQALARELMLRAAAVESPPRAWQVPRTKLRKGPLIMGIVNVTPDSFSDGGQFLDSAAAIRHGLRLADEGADILDVGGESTNPFGSQPLSAADERARVEPVVRELSVRGLCVSIDTTKAEVAKAALDAGAQIVNDVSGLARDPELGQVVKSYGAALCLMHMRGVPQDMQERASYADLHAEVLDELSQALQRARDAGVPDERIALDPGLGFAKTAAHNLTLLRRLRELCQLQRPLVVGASRKSFIGKATGQKEPAQRLFGSLAAAALAAAQGAAVLRVHDVQATKEALQLTEAVRTSPA